MNKDPGPAGSPAPDSTAAPEVSGEQLLEDRTDPAHGPEENGTSTDRPENAQDRAGRNERVPAKENAVLKKLLELEKR